MGEPKLPQLEIRRREGVEPGDAIMARHLRVFLDGKELIWLQALELHLAKDEPNLVTFSMLADLTVEADVLEALAVYVRKPEKR